MSLSWGKDYEVLRNRKNFIQAMGLAEYRFVTFHLTHSPKVALLNDRRLGQPISDSRISLSGFDGAVTDQPGLFFLFCSADCLPLIYFDPGKGVLGVAHAGWKGLLGGIHFNVLKIMVKEFGSKVDDVRVGFGPSILACCNLQSPPLEQSVL